MKVDHYRKKPVQITAAQWDGSVKDATQIIDWMLAAGGTARYHEAYTETVTPYRPDDINTIAHPAHIAIDTLEGVMKVSATDFVIRGVVGEFYPCRADIFQATYEKVSPYVRLDIPNLV